MILVKPPMDPTMLADHTSIFPRIELLSKDSSNHSRLKFWNKTNSSKTNSRVSRHTLQLEMNFPSTLSHSRQDTITCYLKNITEDSDAMQDITFVLEVCELVLRCRSRWNDLLEDVQHIGTVVLRPGIHLRADGRLFIIPDTIGLRDFTSDRRMASSLDSYDSLLPNVSQKLTLTVTAILRNQVSGHRIHTTSSMPVFVLDYTTQSILPPAYNRLEAEAEAVPPAYEA